MSNIEDLHIIFKYFELCGIQNFSLNDLKESKQSMQSKIIHFFYFIFLVVTLPYAMHYFFFSYPISGFEPKKFMINVMMRVLGCTLISSVVFGLLESNFKSRKFQSAIRLVKKLAKIYNQTLMFHPSFKALRNKFAYAVPIFITLNFLNVLALGLSAVNANDSIFPALIGFIPVHFELLVLFVFNFYVELINFEIEILIFVVSKSMKINIFDKTVNFTSTKAFAICRCYRIIHEMSSLVNDFLCYSSVIVWSNLVMASISNIYNNLIEISLGTTATLFTFFVQICMRSEI